MPNALDNPNVSMRQSLFSRETPKNGLGKRAPFLPQVMLPECTAFKIQFTNAKLPGTGIPDLGFTFLKLVVCKK